MGEPIGNNTALQVAVPLLRPEGQGGEPGSTSDRSCGLWLWEITSEPHFPPPFVLLVMRAGHGVRAAGSQGAVNIGQTGGPPMVETGFGGPSVRHPASYVTECGFAYLNPMEGSEEGAGQTKIKGVSILYTEEMQEPTSLDVETNVLLQFLEV